MNPQTLLHSIKKLRVLIVGDVMIDRYLRGKVDRISPEAPVPIVRLHDTEDRLGGAGNVALNIKAMGATPVLCSVTGSDDNALKLDQLLTEAGISTEGMLRSEERCTTVKTRVMAAHQHLLRVDHENTHELSKSEQKAFLSLIDERLEHQQIDVILFQDYNKGVLNLDLIQQISERAFAKGIPMVVDPKFRHFMDYLKVDLFKPNLKEIREALPFPVEANLSSLTKASDYLRQKMQQKHTLITLSDKGIFIDNGERQTILPTQARSIADVCGAGDTVISIAALGIGLGLNLVDIAILANIAGGQVCEKAGVVPVDATQLLREYEAYLQNTTLP